MTQHNINTLLDDFEQFIEDELTTIESKAYAAGYDRGYIKGVCDGVQQIAQSDIENEYYTYLEAYCDGYRAGYDDADHGDEYDNSM